VNHPQITKLENVLLAALSFLQQHPPKGISPDTEMEYDNLIAELRVSLGLVRTWRALARSLGQSEPTEPELPGQMHMFGADPGEPEDQKPK
jgi:hypothetical protein